MSRFLLQNRSRKFWKGTEGASAIPSRKRTRRRLFQVAPSLVFEIGSMVDMAKEAKPFDKGPLDIAGSKLELG